ncbi:electron carrier/ protein disulfide oxidoreductase [Anaeramoeba flamelloides]|uniref:Electron carrier/ protein disulfide oxidoreductase n=1 Tax=Anaeramoeba flamelloides TaxID=1746091 RepID=A0AAV7ZRT4_9EUKA|nr:electron carrier/ protein disulfide oxidoreductase [Anaeramoeba flamelloides]
MIFHELVHSRYPEETKRPMGHTTLIHLQTKLDKVRKKFDKLDLDPFHKQNQNQNQNQNQKQKNNERKKAQNFQHLKNKFSKTNTQHQKVIKSIEQISSDEIQFLNEALQLHIISQSSTTKRFTFGSFFNKNSHQKKALQTEFLKLNLHERSSEPKLMGVITEKNKKKIRKLKKKISLLKNSNNNNNNSNNNNNKNNNKNNDNNNHVGDHNDKFENPRKNLEHLKLKIVRKQHNLKNLIWNNNRLRTYLDDKQKMKTELSNQLIEFSNHNSQNSENSSQLYRITEQKKQQQMDMLRMEIKKIQFNTQNASKRLIEKSNTSLKQKLAASKLRLMTLKKEENRLEAELRKLVKLKKRLSLNVQSEMKYRLTSSNSSFFQDYFERNSNSTDESEHNSETAIFVGEESNGQSYDEASEKKEISIHITQLKLKGGKGKKKSRDFSPRNNFESGIPLQEKNQLQIKGEKKEKYDESSEDYELLTQLDQLSNQGEGEGEGERQKKNKVNILNQNKEEKHNKEVSIDSIEILLTIPAAVEYFSEYLNHEMCQENLLFYIAVKNFKNLLNSNQMEKKIASMAKMIYCKYIKTGSFFEVNIDYQCREKIINYVKKKEFSINMFNEAQDIVFSHLKNDQYKGFMNSRLYSKLLKKIQSKNGLHFDTIAKKATIITREKNVKVLNIDFWFKGGAENAILVSYKLLSHLIQILNAHYSINCAQIDFNVISQSISFNRFIAATTELQKVKLDKLTGEEKICFFLNIYNTLLIHGGIINGIPNRGKEFENFTQNTIYKIGGLEYSLSDIRYGILHWNRDKQSNEYFKKNDPRIQFVLQSQIDHRINFAINSFESTSIFLQTYIPEQLDLLLEKATKLQLAKGVQFIKNKIIFSPRIKILLKDFDNVSLSFIKFLLPYLGVKRQKFIKNVGYKINISFRKNSNFLPMFTLESESVFVKKYSDEYKF